jgi:hypothetical protein
MKSGTQVYGCAGIQVGHPDVGEREQVKVARLLLV